MQSRNYNLLGLLNIISMLKNNPSMSKGGLLNGGRMVDFNTGADNKISPSFNNTQQDVVSLPNNVFPYYNGNEPETMMPQTLDNNFPLRKPKFKGNMPIQEEIPYSSYVGLPTSYNV